MSRFEGTIPVPEYNTGDIVQVLGGKIGAIRGIQILWEGKSSPSVNYKVLGTWYTAARIQAEFKKVSEEKTNLPRGDDGITA